MENILWVNPSFLDYRIPLYGEINKKLKGNFNLLYSKQRIPERCHKHVLEVLGENAHYLTQEKIYHLGKNTSEFANTSINIPFPSGLYKQIKKVRPDAIISEGFFQFTPWAVAYSFIHRIPLYIAYERTAHTERRAPLWRRLYRKFIGLFVAGYLANGELTKEYLMSQGVKENKIHTGGMCADSDNLRIQSEQMTESEKHDFLKSIFLDSIAGLRYIYVGQIIKRKGLIHLLESWIEHIKEFPNDELLIVGDGEFFEEYSNQFKDFRSIIFLGKTDYSQIYKYYAVSDVFVIPTLEDNWSLVVPEAMACGLPIACSIYNGCYPELVHKDINGITFDTLNKTSLLGALKYFHGVDLKSFGAKSREIEANFSPEKTADNVINMLKTNYK